jgi:hypothetical protein
VQTTIDLLTEPVTETTESTEQTATDKKAAKVIKFSKSAYEKISIKKKIKKKPKRLKRRRKVALNQVMDDTST